MKKLVFLLSIIVLLLILPTIRADVVAFEFNKVVINDIVAKELTIPAKFNLTIINHNLYEDYFKVYSLVDLKITPLSPIYINASQQKTVSMGAQPLRWLNEKGMHSIEYYIKGDRSGATTDTILIKVLPISEILFADVPTTISRDDAKIVVTVINKENINLGETQLTIHNDFFSTTKDINISPKSTQKIELPLDQEQLKTAKAGEYPLETTFFLNKEYNYTIDSKVTLQEYTSVTTTESSRLNFLGFVKTIIKKNEGNTAKLITIEAVKSRFETAFTSYNIQPTYENASVILVTLGWQREIQPGESFSVEITTDYTIPVLILALIIIAAISIYLTKRPRVIIRKKAARVHTKGGEFAIKVVLFIRNIGKEIQEVTLTDRLPHVTKLYERFGSIRPDKIETNRLEWNFGILAPGQERVVSYIVYSKVMPVGTIALPQASISYMNVKQQKKVTYSNRVLVVGEPSVK